MVEFFTTLLICLVSVRVFLNAWDHEVLARAVHDVSLSDYVNIALPKYYRTPGKLAAYALYAAVLVGLGVAIIRGVPREFVFVFPILSSLALAAVFVSVSALSDPKLRMTVLLENRILAWLRVNKEHLWVVGNTVNGWCMDDKRTTRFFLSVQTLPLECGTWLHVYDDVSASLTPTLSLVSKSNGVRKALVDIKSEVVRRQGREAV